MVSLQNDLKNPSLQLKFQYFECNDLRELKIFIFNLIDLVQKPCRVLVFTTRFPKKIKRKKRDLPEAETYKSTYDLAGQQDNFYNIK